MYKKNEIDLTQGSVFIKLIQFSVPLIFSSLLQILFNTADRIVVGQYCSSASFSAVTSTGSLINLLVNLFTGLSIGTNIVAANYFGAGKKKEINETVHTAILLSFYSGIILTVIGIIFAKPILIAMGAQNDFLDLAVIYLRIYFGGITATMVYNFGSALLRAKGDTKRPLYILTIAGVINFLLNLFFVIVCKMSVDGVGYATVLSQVFASIAVIFLLVRENDEFHLDFHKLKMNSHIFTKIVKIGVPAGFQGIMFSFSNVIIQSSVNSFGEIVINGNGAAADLEGFVYFTMNGFAQGALTFCSQNLGARKIDRIKKVVIVASLAVVVMSGLGSLIFLFFGRNLIGFYQDNPKIIDAGMMRIHVIITCYYLCGIMDVLANSLRGIGYSMLPFITSLTGACIFRIIYLFTIFRMERFHNPITIYLSYPFSWTLTITANLIIFIVVFRRLKNKIEGTEKINP